MATNLIPPTRRERISSNGMPERRLVTFFEEIAKAIPDQIPHIADVSGLTIAGNQAKINEILAAMVTAGIMEPSP